MQVLLKRLLVFCFTLLLILVVLRVGWARVIVSDNPQKSLKYLPEYSEALLARSENIFGQIKENVMSTEDAQGVRDRAQRALLRAPMNGTSFLHIALTDSIMSGTLVNREVFLEAKKRNIHNRRAIKSLIALDFAENNLPSVIRNLDVLVTLGGNSIQTYKKSLAGIYALEQGREIIDGYLPRKPSWGPWVLSTNIANLKARNIDSMVTSMSKYTDSNYETKKLQILHKEFFEKLINLEAYERAYSVWNKMLAPRDRSSDYLNHSVFDYKFLGSIAPAPFNWSLLSTSKYFSEIIQEGGLYASFANPSVRVIAYQVLMLEPGKTYKLQTKARWAYKSRQGVFSWRVKCLPKTRKNLVDVVLGEENQPNEEIEIQFAIPRKNCAAQQISLIGVPGQYSKRIWTEIEYLKIIPLRP